MKRFCCLAIFFCLIPVAAFNLAGGAQTKKQPVPDKKALNKAEDLVNDIFKDEIGKASDADSRTKLAVYLAQQGDESGDDPAARYVLYRQARDLAVLAGNPALALNTIDKLTQHFDLPGSALKTEALVKLVDHVPTKEPSKALTELALAMALEALESDNYDMAVELGKVATAAAKKSQVVILVATVAKRNAEIQAAKEKFGVLQPFVDRLAKEPDDVEANLRLGEYFGLFKGKWDRAIPHLAKSKSEPLASLAAQDLAAPKVAKDQAALADAWWEFAAKQSEPQKTRLQERAAYWYEKALPGLSGLSQTKAQKRLGQTTPASSGVTPAANGPLGFLKTLDAHTNEIRALAISGDGRFGLSGSVDYSMRLWNLETGKELQIFTGHAKQVWSVAFMPDDKLAISASWDGTVKFWDLSTHGAVHKLVHPLDVNGIAVSKDGKWLLTGCDDKYLRLWDLTKFEEVKKFGPHNNFCYACAFAPNGLLVASGGNDRRAKIFDLATGKEVREIEQNNAVTAIAFSPDSKYLFTCGDNAAHMWDIATGKEDRKFEPPSGNVNCMALTTDGRRLVTGGEDKLVRVWDVASGKEIVQYPGHTTPITALAISSDGRQALTGQADGTIRCWGLPAR